MNSDRMYLEHILDEVEFLNESCKDKDIEDLVDDPVLQRASLRSLEIIGEAVKNVSLDLRERHTDIEWKKLAGLRDKLIHHYFGVDWTIVWDVITRYLPGLQQKIEMIINRESED